MYDFKSVQDRVRKLWKDRDIFAKSMDPNRGGKLRKDFVWFEGPPTANGSPGIHHFIGRSYKDLFGRYRTMRGYHVLRRGGWDTHGLPVELQVEKELGFKSKKDIEAYGVAKFNAKCRTNVWQYLGEWEEFTRKMAFWVDLDSAYITYEAPYIESLWNIIGEFASRKLLYQAHRVVPFCTRCGTPLSSHEVALGYQKVTDRSVTIAFKAKTPFKLKGTDQGMLSIPKGTSILAWTTTPWTLPGNVALAVGNDITYVLARRGEEYFIIAKEVAVDILGAPLAIEAEFPGSSLIGMKYEPLFAIPKLKTAKSYRVYPADFVSTSEGTGIVHTAVMYGEDDYQLGKKVGLPTHHTVTEQGTFEGVHKDLNGKYVKDPKVEQKILDMLAVRGRLVREDQHEHDYPFCWRCSTPLLYYAKDSWFVRMSSLRDDMIAANEDVNWIPDNFKHGRFGQWISEGKDWAFSRERYWGTPLPVWMERDGRGRYKGDPLVIRSFDELDTFRADMPANLWVMRHGESTKNIAHVIDQGQGESPLTPAGIEQAIKAARALRTRLARKKTKVAIIIASPVQRTKETAELVARELGITKVIYDTRLKEINLGPSLVGCHDEAYHKKYPTYESKFGERPPGGESLADLRVRMWEVLKDLNEQYSGKQVLIVSHEYPIWMLQDAAAGWSQERSIREKESRGDDFVTYASPEPCVVRNLPRNEQGIVDPHRPYVDDIVLRHPKTKKLLYRIPDLVDVWFDSGSMPYAQWHWPFENEDAFNNQFPADFITEAHDQTRGWYYTLMAVSVALGKGAPYRNVLSYGHVLDDKGQKMSKSKGNVIKPDAVMDEVGVDAARWYFYTINAPGDVKLFSMKDARERLTGFIMILENCVKFWELYQDAPDGGSEYHHGAKPEHLLDRWLFSRLHRLIRETTEYMDAYDYVSASRAIELFTVEDLSQWWLRRSRRRTEALGLLRHVLLELDKLIAPFVPYASEDIHLRLHTGTTPSTESVHLHDWPEADSSFIDVGLEEQMARVREFITDGLAQRSQAGIKVRQPLPAVNVPLAKALPEDLEKLVKDELNVKEVRYEPAQQVGLDTAITPVLRHEGWAREVVRTIQGMRKDAGLKMGEQARGMWHSEDEEVVAVILEWSDTIAKETSLAIFTQQSIGKGMAVEKEFELAPSKTLSLGIAK